jgi:hypothetical protein
VSDRRQIATVVSVAAIVLLVVVLVAEQLLAQMPPPGSIKHVCGSAGSCGYTSGDGLMLLWIALLTIVASRVVSVPKELPPTDGDDGGDGQ